LKCLAMKRGKGLSGCQEKKHTFFGKAAQNPKGRGDVNPVRGRGKGQKKNRGRRLDFLIVKRPGAKD